MSQEQLARRLREAGLAAGTPDEAKWDQSKVSRYESSPDKVPMGDLQAMLRELGVDNPWQVIPKPDGPQAPPTDAGTPYEALDRDLSSLRDFVAARVWDSPEDGVATPPIGDLLRLCDRLAERPRVAFFGRFDVGKSTLVNTMLGKQSMPTSYQPATRAVTFVRHLTDRPAWLLEDVLVLRDGFDTDRWDDEEHCLAHKITAGGLETLQAHGSYRGRAVRESDPACVLVFLEAPILNSCTIVDLPGTDNNERDTTMATRDFSFDVAVFADLATGFMSEGALLRLGAVLKALPAIETIDPSIPPLSNLFIVATHAHADISDEALEDEILTEGRARAWRQVEDSVIQQRVEAVGVPITRADFEARFYAFYRELPKRRAPLLDAVRTLLSTDVPRVVRLQADREIQRYKEESDSRLSQTISFYQSALEDRSAIQAQLTALQAAEPQRMRTVKLARQSVEEAIGRHRAETREEISSYIRSHTAKGSIEKVIRDKFPDKKDAQQNAAAYILEQIQSKAEKEARERTQAVTELVEDFIGEYDEAALTLVPGVGTVTIPFNSKGAFAGGLVGLVSVGGLAMWASTLGNLGAYILVAKGVSVLSAIGISTGGTAAWVAAVSSIGGPVTLAIGIVVITALLGWAFLRSSWEERLAKKISSELRDRKVETAYLDGIATYWDSTAAAFESGADNAELVWTQHLADMRRIVDESSIDQITDLISGLGGLRSFFLDLPWPSLIDDPLAATNAPGR